MLVVTAITIFVLPLSWAGSLSPWKSWQTLLPILLGAALLVMFVLYEAKPSVPILPHRLFHSRTANMTLAAAFVHGMILISLLQYLPLFCQAVELETAIRSAVSLFPTVVISVVFAAISMMMVSVASVKNVDDTGLAIGLLLTIRMFGGLIGLTVASTIFNSVFSASITSIELTGSLSQLNNPNKAVSFISELRSLETSPKVLDAVLRIYLGCFKTIFCTMAGSWSYYFSFY
ncbi:putative major facilitator superfamily protein [Botrytis fragariae]|uniref:Putative major facilitator superfamily protein n=1 Tax=Botrytis fragariae TaxID=1964551 RepID=A0A8H6AHV4_9HELO|nr:putative major facilitator superfamily protein [Botrytis fragariae]KAF5867508.1 putative major facilitator superfamily protein [Botrytis fragariae]